MVTVALLFFFSSRRRHTRCSRDWSSDVCSSDLSSLELIRRTLDAAKGVPGAFVASGAGTRSEERRVGKECRAGRRASLLEEKLVEDIDDVSLKEEAPQADRNDVIDRGARRLNAV